MVINSWKYIYVTASRLIGYTLLNGHRPLMALIRLGGPSCLVLQSSWDGDIPPMAAKADVCHKNQCLIN